jgi:DNA-binding transcriptional regulator LsrR (DeoR family)
MARKGRSSESGGAADEPDGGRERRSPGKGRKGQERRPGRERAGKGKRVEKGKTAARRRKPHLGVTADETRLLEALEKLLWKNGLPAFRPFADVAKEMRLTVPAVVALWRKAYERKLWFPYFQRPAESTAIARLEHAVRTRYRLRKCRLVPGFSEILRGDLDAGARRAIRASVLRALAPLVVEHVVKLVERTAARGETAGTPRLRIGVAWGHTMSVIAQQLPPRWAAPQLPGLEVVPIIAPTSTWQATPVEANVIAMQFAQVFGGRSAQLPCPAFIRLEDADLVMRIPDVREVQEKIVATDVVITSLGPVLDDGTDADMTFSGNPERSAEIFAWVKHSGAAGEICSWFFDRTGKQIPPKVYRSIGLGFEGLQATAADPARQVVLAAGGDRRRFEAVRAALRGRLASVLFTDTVTARFLVGELDNL